MECGKSKVLIVGVGVAGTMVHNKLKIDTEMEIVGYVDDDAKKWGLTLCGLTVLGNRFDLPVLIDKYRVDIVIIAIPSAHPAEIGKIIEICKKAKPKLKVKILSGTVDLSTMKIKALPIRDVQVDDMLGRKPLTLDAEEIQRYIRGQTVLITGAGGSVGTELSKHVVNCNPLKLILLGRGENSIYEAEQQLKLYRPDVKTISEIADIKDSGRITRLFNSYRPGLVFHAAAHKHVPYMERIPEEAVKNNILGTKVLCEAAYSFGCEKFIFISTDKAVKPTSIMGATKKVAETIMLMKNDLGGTKYASVRFGNILGSRGSVVPLFERQISIGGPVTITHPDMMRYFMTVGEAAQLVLQAGAMSGGGEIFVLDIGEPICIKDLAYKMISLRGLAPEKDISITYTGIRPGEKITEILVEDDEEMLATRHDKIYAIRKNNKDYANAKKIINELLKPNFSFGGDEIKKLLSVFLQS